MNVLIIKLSPIDGLNSSTMRALALAHGLKAFVTNIDYVTIPASNTHTISNNTHSYNQLNVIYASNNKAYDFIVSNKKKSLVKKTLINVGRLIYHKFAVYNYTKEIAQRIDIKLLPQKDYDLVISISDPKTSHIAVKKLIKQGLSYSKWVQYWGDPLTLDITNKNVYPKSILRKIERNLFSNSDVIIYASPITLSKQKELFSNLSEKMHFLPTPYLEVHKHNKTNNKSFNIGYFGAYKSDVRDIYPLYDSVASMDLGVNLTIVGDSDLNLEQKSNIKIYERQDITSFENKVDLLVCILNKRGTQIPGKVFHYASTSKPILLILDGEYAKYIGDYFSKFNRYYICNNNKEEILKKIIEIMNENQNEFPPIKEFSSIEVAKQIFDIINIDPGVINENTFTYTDNDY